MVLDIRKTIFLISIFILACIRNSHTGLNTLHLADGTSTAELISGDIFFEIIEPEELEYTYRIRPAKDFGAPFNSSFYIKNVPLVPVVPKYGCIVPKNRDDIEGNVAFIERGECSFKTKVLIAEKSGARAVIITDTTTANEDYYIEMIDDETDTDVSIPAGYLMGRNGLMITKTLERLNLNYAIINLPINLTFTPVHQINQPPWLGW